VDGGALPVEEWPAGVEEGHVSRIPPFFLGIPLARGFAEDIKLSLRNPSGECGIGRKVKVHTAGQLVAVAG
jgi:hypothetical protein